MFLSLNSYHANLWNYTHKESFTSKLGDKVLKIALLSFVRFCSWKANGNKILFQLDAEVFSF